MKGTVVFDFDDTLADTVRFKDALAKAADEEAVILRMPEFILPGAASVLHRLKAGGWKLALLTLGEPSWQKRKTARSGLLAFFDFALYTSKPKETRLADFADWPKPLVFVNDNGKEIEAMRPALSDARFIAVRGPKPLPSDPDVPVCENLEEAYTIILSL
jgi:FMN phosphatase YigB (HAD superfamily)